LRNKKISTQQSTWMEMALEDGGGTAEALGVSIGRRHWDVVEDAGAVLGGTNGRRTCNNGVGVSIVKEPPLASPLLAPPNCPQFCHRQCFIFLKNERTGIIEVGCPLVIAGQAML
jgi:hypothetical protein